MLSTGPAASIGQLVEVDDPRRRPTSGSSPSPSARVTRESQAVRSTYDRASTSTECRQSLPAPDPSRALGHTKRLLLPRGHIPRCQRMGVRRWQVGRQSLAGLRSACDRRQLHRRVLVPTMTEVSNRDVGGADSRPRATSRSRTAVPRLCHLTTCHSTSNGPLHVPRWAKSAECGSVYDGGRGSARKR